MSMGTPKGETTISARTFGGIDSFEIGGLSDQVRSCTSRNHGLRPAARAAWGVAANVQEGIRQSAFSGRFRASRAAVRPDVALAAMISLSSEHPR